MSADASLPITEQSSYYDHLEDRPVIELLRDMNMEDQKVAPAVRKVLPMLAQFIEQIVPRMKKGGRIFYLGAGTSGRLGVLDASELPPTFGVPPTFVIGLIAGGDIALRQAVENAEDNERQGWEELLAHGVNQEDTVIGIAASGTTPYVVGAVRQAHDHGILTGCITSNPHTPLAAAADYPIEMIVGPEFITGSSRMKSGTGQKMILNMISTAVMIRLGRVKGNRMVNMQLTNQKLIDRGTRMLAEALHIDYGQARRQLLLYGSVEKAMEAHAGAVPCGGPSAERRMNP
ncbi:MAG: N-acetylmuramic acid 6-phosphate etherase [Prevotellaceae bacterium]|nr:N-acetylmuramic acid 6-phosphate etherase [Prevotellaceae bacterium]